MLYLQFAVLGLGLAAAYSLLASGLILIYRASGVLNFAQGAYAMTAAYVFYEARVNHGWPYAWAFVLAVVTVSILGWLTYVLLMKPLRHAAPIVRIIATLGVLSVLDAAANIRYQGSVITINESLPNGTYHWGVVIPQVQLILIGISLVVSFALYLVSSKTTFGLATRATAENERTAAGFGWSGDLVAGVNWAAGAGLAAVAGVLIVPLTGLTSQSVTLLVVPALAVALFGAFSSFPMAFIGAVLLGVGQGLTTKWQSSFSGASDLVPFLLILIVLIWRRQAIPRRGESSDRMPALGTGKAHSLIVLPLVVIGVIGVLYLPITWVIALGISLVIGVVLLSVVVVTGYAGQLSLGQFALAGLGVLFAAQLVTRFNWPFLFALIAGIVGATLCGLIFGLPSLRSRGTQLAIVTLSLGTLVQSAIFTNASYTGGSFGFSTKPQRLFGFPFNDITYPRTYTMIVLLIFVVAWYAVTNLRRSRLGLRMVSIRANERAAASLGVNVSAVKLAAFSTSAGIAALGGILSAFSTQSIALSQGFDPLTSINAVLLSVVGGVAHASGAVFGGELASGGLPGGVIANSLSSGSGGEWLVLIGGLLVLLTLRLNPDGIASALAFGRKMAQRSRGKSAVVTPSNTDREDATSVGVLVVEETEEKQPTSVRMADSVLTLSELSVSFGGVRALRGVDLTVRSGEIIGLIGPNGSGKTTLIDAVTGFVQSTGSISLNGESLEKLGAHRRARRGVTRSFQSLELFDDVTVEENLRAAVDGHNALAYFTGLLPAKKESRSELVQTVIDDFHLESVLEELPSALSYGQRRLVAIARAVATNPKFLLLDEPAAGLGSSETEELSRLVTHVAHTWNVGVLLIEHDMSMVLGISDRIAVLDFGEKIADGTPGEIRENPKVVAAYLGVEADEVSPVEHVETIQ